MYYVLTSPQNQPKNSTREWDLNDPNALKKQESMPKNVGMSGLQRFAGEDEKHQANRRFVLQNKKSSKYFLKLKLHICSYRVFEKEGRRQKLNTMQMFSLDSVSLRKLKCFSCSQSMEKHFKLDNWRFPFLMTSV